MTFYKVNNKFFLIPASAFQYAIEFCENTIQQRLQLERLDRRQIGFEYRWTSDQTVIHYFYDQGEIEEYVCVGIYKKVIFDKQEVAKIFQEMEKQKNE